MEQFTPWDRQFNPTDGQQAHESLVCEWLNTPRLSQQSRRTDEAASKLLVAANRETSLDFSASQSNSSTVPNGDKKDKVDPNRDIPPPIPLEIPPARPAQAPEPVPEAVARQGGEPFRLHPFLPRESDTREQHIPLPLKEKIDKWIEDLDDDKYAVREKARRSLIECPSALGPIRKKIEELKGTGKNESLEQKRGLPMIIDAQNAAKLEELKTDLTSEDESVRRAAYKSILQAQSYDYIAERLVPDTRRALHEEKDPIRRAGLKRALDHMNACGDGCELDHNGRIARVYHPGTSNESFRITYEGDSNDIKSIVFPDRMFEKYFGGVIERRAHNNWFDLLRSKLTNPQAKEPLNLRGKDVKICLRENGVFLSTETETGTALTALTGFNWYEHTGLYKRLFLEHTYRQDAGGLR